AGALELEGVRQLLALDRRAEVVVGGVDLEARRGPGGLRRRIADALLRPRRRLAVLSSGRLGPGRLGRPRADLAGGGLDGRGARALLAGGRAVIVAFVTLVLRRARKRQRHE